MTSRNIATLFAVSVVELVAVSMAAIGAYRAAHEREELIAHYNTVWELDW